MKSQLKNWSYGTSQKVDAYTAPEMIFTQLQGNVYGHPNSQRHPDGKFIVTSAVKGKRNGLVVTQSGSEYELIDVDPGYEKEYPNAFERLMKTLPEIL
jgi:hypothetical protein